MITLDIRSLVEISKFPPEIVFVIPGIPEKPPEIPEKEDAFSRDVLRKMVLFSPNKISAGIAFPADIVIFFHWYPVRAFSMNLISFKKPPFNWGGTIHLTVRSTSSLIEVPNLDKIFYPFVGKFENQSFENFEPNHLNINKLIEYRKNWLLQQLETDLFIPFSNWINTFIA